MNKKGMKRGVEMQEKDRLIWCPTSPPNYPSARPRANPRLRKSGLDRLWAS